MVRDPSTEPARGARRRYHRNWPGVALFFFQAEDGIRALSVPGVQTCALPIPRIHRRGAARAVRSGTGSREPAAAVRAERLQPPGPTAAEGAGDRFTLLAGDRRARDDARARQGRAPRRRLPPTPPPPPGDSTAVLRPGDLPLGFPPATQNWPPGP